MNRIARRISYVFLCALPFLAAVVVGMRGLRIEGVYQAIGVALLAAIVIAAWTLGARMTGFSAAGTRRLALAGALLILPWAIISLLWIGLGAPFQATASENYMRFLVLLADTAIVASGFVVLKEELYDAGERFYSTLGFAASIPAGTAYLVSISISVASSLVALSAKGATSGGWFREFYSVLEFVACILTYIATAAFATSLGRARWLGPIGARAFVAACAVLVLLIVTRGLSFPALTEDTTPWYFRAAFIAGIPAVPWIMPCLLGVVLLRRAGDEQQAIESARTVR
jgi:hypothetical protein